MPAATGHTLLVNFGRASTGFVPPSIAGQSSPLSDCTVCSTSISLALIILASIATLHLLRVVRYAYHTYCQGSKSLPSRSAIGTRTSASIYVQRFPRLHIGHVVAL